MSDHKSPAEEDEPLEPAKAASGAAPAGAEPPAEQLKEIIGALQAEIDATRSQNLHLLADMDNLRKRTEREKEETAKYAITRFARDVVTVADNFERAVQAVPPGAAEADPALKSLVDGVSMTERELMNVLERYGVKRIFPKGEIFNPHQHQAMTEIEDVTVAPGTVLEVYQPGYIIEERVLRPAMVVLAKGGPKPVRPEVSQPGPSAVPGRAPGAAGTGGEDADNENPDADIR